MKFNFKIEVAIIPIHVFIFDIVLEISEFADLPAMEFINYQSKFPLRLCLQLTIVVILRCTLFLLCFSAYTLCH